MIQSDNNNLRSTVAGKSSRWVLLLTLFIGMITLLQQQEVSATTSKVGCTYPIERRNDNYCDCPLTSEDETETEACAPIGQFKCADRQVFFPTSRVNDGVCDCCDGSDEPKGKCKNACEELDRRERERVEQLAATQREGEKGFMELVERAKGLCLESKEKEQGKPRTRPEEQKALEDELKKAEDELATMETDYSNEANRDRIDSLYLSKLSKEDLEDLVVELATELKGGVTLERMVAKRLSCAVKEEGEEGEAYGEDKKSEESEGREPEEETCDPVWTDAVPPASPELEKARELAKTLREKWDATHSDDGEKEDPLDATLDFGPAQVWRALKKKCFKLQKEQYTYEMCVFGEFKQDHVRMGRFTKWSPAHQVQMYENGDRCYSPAVGRSVKVHIQCGGQNELVDVVEPSTCVYEATFKTPAACVPSNVASLSVNECAALPSEVIFSSKL